MGLGLLLGQEQAGGLHHVLSLQLAPGDVGGVALGKDGNGLAVDDDGVLGGLHGAGELAMHGIILQHIGQVSGGAQIVDANDLDLGVIDAGPEDHAADAAKTIDTDFDAHKKKLLSDFVGISIKQIIWYSSDIIHRRFSKEKVFLWNF